MFRRILQQTLAKFDVFITEKESNAVMGIPKPVAIRQLLENYKDDLISITSESINTIHRVFVNDMMGVL